jgi:hypothetical protein
MNAGDLLVLFRSEMADLEQPPLWSDLEVYSYIDDAQKMFCRKTDGISDATTPAVVQFPVVPADSYKPTHKSILRIRSATRADTGVDVEVLNYDDLPARGYRYDGVKGTIKAIVIGEEEGKARTYPVSNETVQINLLVFRLPIKPIADETSALEVAEEHHRHLLYWAKSLAYLKQDSEAFNKSKASEFEAKFITYCAMAKIEQQRKRHKTRFVAYGGI